MFSKLGVVFFFFVRDKYSLHFFSPLGTVCRLLDLDRCLSIPVNSQGRFAQLIAQLCRTLLGSAACAVWTFAP